MNPGRLLFPALRWDSESGFRHEAETIADGLELGVGGFILFGGEFDAVADLTTDLVARAGRPLLIASDLERGAGQQITGLTDVPPPGALGALADPDAIRAAARLTALEARRVGVNWILAPDGDLDLLPENPIVQTRSFGDDPARVAGAVAAWVGACQATGTPACAKHYPGHGRTAVDSHAVLPVVEAPAEVLRGSDEVPFRAAIVAGVAAIMTAHVAFPALDPSGAPATFSHLILQRLRDRLGFEGAVVTDALIMEAARGAGPGPAAVAALRAGCDLLLYPPDVRACHVALTEALQDGSLPEGRVEAALARYAGLLGRVEGPPRDDAPDAAWAAGVGRRLLALPPGRGTLPRLRPPVRIEVVDDDRGGPYPPRPDVGLERLLEGRVPLGPGGSRIVCAFNEPRGWKGRSGFSPEARSRLAARCPDADLVVLFGHPRLVDGLPGQAPVLVAWHRQLLMQIAVAEWIVERLG
ncbi:MAG: glycoside hydrolase family 3 N-terminal domain-containing protein [Gemmatimonadales bacterium]